MGVLIKNKIIIIVVTLFDVQIGKKYLVSKYFENPINIIKGIDPIVFINTMNFKDSFLSFSFDKFKIK